MMCNTISPASEVKNLIPHASMRALNAALRLTASGLLCFPCSHSKKPTCPGGFNAATSDPEALQKLWMSHPGALVGVATGAISGIDVLDIDPRSGGDVWLTENEHKLPPTRRHQSRSGGVHLFFKHHPGLRCSTGRLAPGIDIRADGGCITWWPAAGFPILNAAAPAAWPDWIIQKLLPPRARFFTACDSFATLGTAYASAALRNAVQRMAGAPSGNRNATLNRELWALMRFCVDGQLSPQDIANALAAAALESGLSRQEIIGTITSTMRKRGI